MSNLTPPPAFISKHSWWPSDAEQWTQLKTSPKEHKQFIKTIQTAVADAFKHGAAINECVIGYAMTIDHALWYAWFNHGLHTCNATLLAVGGYGRAELHLQSDIDLMILLGKNLDQEAEEKLSNFLTFLWDTGLDIGHSVRTVKEAVAEARKDITVITSLLEARALCGNITLFNELQKATAPNKIWYSKKFYLAKKDELEIRHRKYGDTLYQLEPNIKEGPGGLRDIQFIEWITKRHFGIRTLGELIGKGFLLEDEYNQLRHSQEYLWKIRFALHLITERKEERLLFDYQVELARLSGHNDSNTNLAVEQYMKNYYRHITECSQLVELLQQNFEETCIPHINWRRKKHINDHFYSIGNVIHVKDKNTFRQHPAAFLELFLIMQQHKHLKKVSSATIRSIKDNLHLIDDNFRNKQEHKQIFIEILRQPNRIAREFKRMNKLGVLAAYWPAFARVVGHMQYDLYHVYTVDHHILAVLQEARNLGDKDRNEDYISALFHKLPKLEILYLGALFHDIAKGRKGDHASEGSQDAHDFCLSHGLSQYDASLVSWLVENHLVMSMTAQHKDINDPSVVQEFADKVENVTRLDYLYLLTVADIRGTNPTLWNDWRSTLLADLHKYTSFQLRASTPRKNSEIIDHLKSSALGILRKQGYTQEECNKAWEELNGDYFLRHTDNEIAWHTKLTMDSTEQNKNQVHIRELVRRGCTEIFIHSRDRKHLFANITDTLHKLNLSVLDARIITSNNGQTYNTFHVIDQNGKAISNQAQFEKIKQEILSALNNDELADIQSSQFISSRLRHFHFKPVITIKNARHLEHTSMHIQATDHPGLLASIAHALAKLEIKVISARVSTLGEKVHDIFYITTRDDKKILDEKDKQALINQLQADLAPSGEPIKSVSI